MLIRPPCCVFVLRLNYEKNIICDFVETKIKLVYVLTRTSW